MCRESQNINFIFNNFFLKSRLLLDHVAKYGGSRRAIDENVADALCMATNT